MIKMRRWAALALVIVATAPAGAQQSAHPDFTGVWVLDATRSDSSSFTPKSATYAIVQAGDSIVVDRETPGTGKSHTVYGLDGKPRTNTLRLVGSETPATSVVSWDHDTLVIHTSSAPAGGELLQTDRWALSANGTMLFMRRRASYAGKEMGSPTLVFIKK